MIPKPIISPPENAFQNVGGTPISTVLAFKSIENRRTDTESEAIIIYGVYLFLASSTEAPSIIGRSGRTHGANTVSTPEKNAMSSSVIISSIINNVWVYNINRA